MREDNLGVTSFARAVFLKPSRCKALLHLFHSDALRLDRLLVLWVRLALRLFSPLTHEEYTVFVADGVKVPREGRKMPAVNTLGSYFYHFWMEDMKQIGKGSGDQYMHRKSDDYRAAVRRKIKAYHAWAQLGCIAQGRLLMHLAVNHHSAVWGKFRSWLRAMRPDFAPSELVVSIALRQSLPEYLFAAENPSDIALFILENAGIDRFPDSFLAA